MGKEKVYDSIDRLIEKHRRWLTYNQHVKNRNNIRTTTLKKTFHNIGITVMTSTIRPEFMENLFENYNRQSYQNKELIIVLNKNTMDINQWIEKAEDYPNVGVFQLDEKLSLGECYNFCVKKAKHDYIATFDDDDYYAPNYLQDIINAFNTSGAEVVGKRARFIYFETTGILAMSGNRYENNYVTYIDGPTLSFDKKIFEKVQFSNVPCGIDVEFCKDCIANGIKMFSTNKYNHVYIRHSLSHNHTWKINDQSLLLFGGCRIVGKIKNYQEYISR